jgi:class 3 adenylate cyclase
MDAQRLDGAAPRHLSRPVVAIAWGLAAALPLIGLLSLLLRENLDPSFEDPRVHFMLFLVVGSTASGLAYAAGEAADRRGDARVLLLSLAFLATGLFLALHAIGTPGILVEDEFSGFKVAIPVGLLVASLFGVASAFVDARPGFAAVVTRNRRRLRASVLAAVVLWCIWTLARVPPLSRPSSEGSATSLLGVMAAVGTVLYGASAIRYLRIYRGHLSLLPASVVACFVLLSEALVGVAVTGERSWHASWWEWHGLIVTAYLIIFFAAHREWRDERFRKLYLSTTRERDQQISVLFCDLAGFTTFSEAFPPREVARMLRSYYEMATPIIWRRYGGEVEKFLGDGIMATFNSRGDQPDHAVRAARAALALQREHARLVAANPGWPRLRVGVNSGDAVVREMGGGGYVAYAVVGDTVNTGSRLEGLAPVGGVLVGAETFRRLPAEAVAEAMPGLLVKGKTTAVDAFVLHSLP